MGQTQLNHIMLLHIYKAQLDSLDLPLVANDFVCGNAKQKQPGCKKVRGQSEATNISDQKL